MTAGGEWAPRSLPRSPTTPSSPLGWKISFAAPAAWPGSRYAGTSTGTTGLEPATSGATGGARDATVFHAKTRETLNSSEFGEP
jgi:hypothetical protein